MRWIKLNSSLSEGQTSPSKELAAKGHGEKRKEKKKKKERKERKMRFSRGEIRESTGSSYRQRSVSRNFDDSTGRLQSHRETCSLNEA